MRRGFPRRGPTIQPTPQSGGVDRGLIIMAADNTISLSSTIVIKKPRRPDRYEQCDKAGLLSHHSLKDHYALFPASQSSDQCESDQDDDAFYAHALFHRYIYTQVRTQLCCHHHHQSSNQKSNTNLP